MPSEGRFDGQRAWIFSPSGAENDHLVASGHEDQHRNLQNSTSFGALTVGVRALADHGFASQSETADGLSLISAPVDEPSRWLTSSDRCIALLDVTLADHLPVWLQTGVRFHYCFLRVESFGRTVAVLVGQVRSEAGATHLMIRGMNTGLVRTLRAGLDELAEVYEIVLDPSLASEGGFALDMAIAHYVGEERIFGIPIIE